MLGDIRQDDRSRTDPAIATDGDLLELSWLISNEAIEAGKSMRVRTAWDLNARPDQHVILNIDPSNMAIVTDIDMFSEAGGRLGDQRSKGDLSRWMAVSQSEAIESAADQGANVAWKQRERLTEVFDSAIGAAEQATDEKEQDPGRGEHQGDASAKGSEDRHGS